METENISNIGNYLVNGLGGGGFRLQPFSPITTLNHSLNSLKGGSDTNKGISGSVAEYLLGEDIFVIPSYAYSGGKITNESVYNNNNNSGEVSVIDDDLHKKLLELAKDDTNDDTNEKANKNTNEKHGTKKRKKEFHQLHLLTRKKHTNTNNADSKSKKNKTRRQPK
jgi:hypothetical protein